MAENDRRNGWAVFGAIALIALGVWLLFERIDNPLFAMVRQAITFAWSVMWPLLLIAAGVILLIASRDGHVGRFRAKKERLYRSRTDRMIGGVLAGVGEYLGVDPTWVRIIYVFLGVFSGFPALIVYIIAMIVIPEEPAHPQRPAWPGEATGTETVQTPPPAPPVPPAPPKSPVSGE